MVQMPPRKTERGNHGAPLLQADQQWAQRRRQRGGGTRCGTASSGKSSGGRVLGKVEVRCSAVFGRRDCYPQRARAAGPAPLPASSWGEPGLARDEEPTREHGDPATALQRIDKRHQGLALCTVEGQHLLPRAVGLATVPQNGFEHATRAAIVQ